MGGGELLARALPAQLLQLCLNCALKGKGVGKLVHCCVHTMHGGGQTSSSKDNRFDISHFLKFMHGSRILMKLHQKIGLQDNVLV